MDQKSLPSCQQILVEQIKEDCLLQNFFKKKRKTPGMDYPAENYIEISFGWKLADCDEF